MNTWLRRILFVLVAIVVGEAAYLGGQMIAQAQKAAKIQQESNTTVTIPTPEVEPSVSPATDEADLEEASPSVTLAPTEATQ